MADTSNSAIGWNVRQDQPYATETQAAADIANPDRKSYMALPTLLGQQAQHSIDTSNYGEQLGQQRAFAYQQLMSKIAENNAKNAIDVMRLGNDNPGAIGFAASNPSTAGSFVGMDPNATALFNDWSSRTNAAKAAEALGKGAQGFLAGGIQMPPGYGTALLPGAPAMQYGDPPLVAAAKIKEAGANARAASGSGGLGWSTTLPYNVETGTQTSVHGKGPPPGFIMGPNGPVPSSSAPSGGSGKAPPNLPMAKTDTPANAPSGSQSNAGVPLPNNAQGNAIRTQVTQAISQSANAPPEVKQKIADITAKGAIDFRHDPKTGKVWIVGKSGNPYPVN